MTHHLLWTGGWDSTFRLLHTLVVDREPVQPYYVIDGQRRGADAERRAMATIRDQLTRRFPEAAARLGPEDVSRCDDIPADPATTARFDRLRERGWLGGQYDWLSRFARWRKLDALELSIHRDDKAHAFLESAVELDSGSYRLRADADDALAVFRPFVFPIFDCTKLDMAATARRHGFANLLEQTWFCHEPDRRGRPCGACNACRYTIEEGLARRVPRINRAKYYARRVIPPSVLRLIRRGSEALLGSSRCRGQ